MSEINGVLNRMLGSLVDGKVHYELCFHDHAEHIKISDCVGQHITLSFSGNRNCIACNRSVNKTFQQGYCFPCTQRLACCDICIIKPELCHFHKGTCREPVWGEKNCMQPHYVYLANSSNIKVGITRAKNIPTRWIDQGATQALQIFKVSTRYMSGLVETIFKNEIADKTNWRRMLQQKAEPVDIYAVRDELTNKLQTSISQMQQQHSDGLEYLTESKQVELEFPISQYPSKIVSLNFDKTPEISGNLMGIKGQYLILDTGVLNIRKFTGYGVACKIF
ncbi:MAG: hypothetical protein COB50_03160 [Thiotrichales bacterium]|nr:MAG: hypothetical protein COB50_03160 [Thiotrichales bacterium]